MNRLGRWVCGSLVSIFVVHTGLWFGGSWLLKREVSRVLDSLKDQGIRVTHNPLTLKGYPTHCQLSLHELTAERPEGWHFHAPFVRVHADLWVLLTHKVHLTTAPTTTRFSGESKNDQLITSALEGWVKPRKQIHVNALSIAMRVDKKPFVEISNLRVALSKYFSSWKGKVSADTHVWLPQFPAVGLKAGMRGDVSFDNCMSVLNRSPQESGLYLDNLELTVEGVPLSLTGEMRLNPRPVSGKLAVRVRRVADFVTLAGRLWPFSDTHLWGLEMGLRVLLAEDAQGGYVIPWVIEEGCLRCQDFPFLKIP